MGSQGGGEEGGGGNGQPLTSFTDCKLRKSWGTWATCLPANSKSLGQKVLIGVRPTKWQSIRNRYYLISRE